MVFRIYYYLQLQDLHLAPKPHLDHSYSHLELKAKQYKNKYYNGKQPTNQHYTTILHECTENLKDMVGSLTQCTPYIFSPCSGPRQTCY